VVTYEELAKTVILVIIPIFLAAFILYVIRAIKGPTIPDIVLAINALSFDVAAFMVILSIYFSSPFLISGAIVLAVWAYALDIFVAKYYEKKEIGE